jgi:hypothetical protein
MTWLTNSLLCQTGRINFFKKSAKSLEKYIKFEKTTRNLSEKYEKLEGKTQGIFFYSGKIFICSYIRLKYMKY